MSRAIKPTSTRTRAAIAAASLALAGAALTGPVGPSAAAGVSTLAAAPSIQHGPTPTNRSVQATQGTYAVTSFTVSDSDTNGFGSATVSYPTKTSEGRFGAVAISPGFVSPQSSVAWMGPRFASFGFVVVTFDTNSPFDQPASRGTQLLAALDFLTNDARTSRRVDPARQAVVGHSMGGGGTLEAAKVRPGLQAAVGLTPYDTDKSWPEVKAAFLSIGAQNDNIAPAGQHAIPFYESTTNAERRTYLELEGADHFAPYSPNDTIAKYTISWLKRFVDSDTRYEKFLTPGPKPAASPLISDYRVG